MIEEEAKHETSMKQVASRAEMSVDFQRTTHSYIQEDRTLHNRRRQNL
jgi:hypothetical protein